MFLGTCMKSHQESSTLKESWISGKIEFKWKSNRCIIHLMLAITVWCIHVNTQYFENIILNVAFWRYLKQYFGHVEGKITVAFLYVKCEKIKNIGANHCIRAQLSFENKDTKFCHLVFFGTNFETAVKIKKAWMLNVTLQPSIFNADFKFLVFQL